MILIVGLFVALAAVAFAVANRASVALQLWPLPYTYEAPIFILVFAGIGIGFAIGLVFACCAGFARRRRNSRAACSPTTGDQSK
jgi:uncharacterized integral membrane protein